VRKVLVLVEGQTEERFVKEVLCPKCLQSDVFMQPVVLATKRSKVGIKFKGGVSTYSKIRADVLRLLGDSSASAVTTLLDYYGLPDDFPGRDRAVAGDCYQKVAYLESCFAEDIKHEKFRPFLMLHEFETMLFSNIERVVEAFNNRETCLDKMKSVLAEFHNIEEINEGGDTHPSSRILKIFNDYQKALHGPLITGRIGIDRIRAACRHFDEWLGLMENPPA